MTLSLVDSHCHLDFDDFGDELDEVVARARSAGIVRMLTICTRPEQRAEVLAIAERYDDVYCAVGVHPHEAQHHTDLTVDGLIRLADHPKVVGIGETGLDFHYDHSPREAQAAVFRTHIRAARTTGLPLIVHTRNADPETICILDEEGAGQGAPNPLSGVIHCFSTGRELAEKAISFGFYVSLSGILTFKAAEDLRQTVLALPLERLMVETDAPYLAPAPKRGKRNEPSLVVHTAQKLADLKGLAFDAVAEKTTENFFTLFSRVPRLVT